MKANLEKVGSLGRKLNITVPAETVNTAFERVFKGIQKEANIKGFRQGKAPLATIKSIYGERVKQDVVQELVQRHYHQALQAEQLDPISYPEFEFEVPQENKEFNFTANFEVKPEISLKKYEGLEIETEKYEFDEKRVDEVLKNIQNSRAQLVDVLEERPAQSGETAIVDFDGFVDGKPLEGGKGIDHQLELGSHSFIDGFEEGIIGMKIGESKTLNLKFPSPYHSAELAGKPVEFKVTLKSLKKKSLPELNDEFIKQLMGQGMGAAAAGGEASSSTLEGLKETIRKDIEESEKKRIEGDLKNRLLKKLVELNPVEIPHSMLTEQKAALVEDMKKKMLDQGLSDEQFAEYTQKWDGDFSRTASEMIQSGFLIDAIAKKHDLIWSDEDLKAKFDEYAKQTGIELARIKEFYGKPEQQNRLTYMITEEKVIKFLLDTTKLKEVPASKLKESKN
jgi:trigger factor